MCWIYTAQKQTGNCRNGRREKKRSLKETSLFLCVLADSGVSVGYVTWKRAYSERLAGGVAPGAGEGIVCANEAETGTGS